MARPKEFDPDVAVERAMHAFWCRGYDGTSVQDLVDATGVGRASLYGTFGSKDELYGAALDRYRELETTRAMACLAGDGEPLERIAALFDRFVSEPLEDPDNRGCLILNAAMERAEDAATAARVRAIMRDFEEVLRELLTEARDAGDLPADRDPRELARFLVTSLQGLRVMAKATRDEPLLRAAQRVTLRALTG